MQDSLIIRDACPADAEDISARISSLARYFLADTDRPEAAAVRTGNPPFTPRTPASEEYRIHRELNGY